MKVHYKRFVTITVCGLFLAGSFGCAQTRLNVKDTKGAEAAVAARLQAITISPDGSTVDITADRPLTYTFYKTGAPPKAVIDLSQTEAGAISTPIEVGRGNIRRIDVTKHELGGGSLTRIEVLMNDEGDAIVAPVTDKSKLQVVFSPGNMSEKQGTAVASAEGTKTMAAPAAAKGAETPPAAEQPPVAPQSGKSDVVAPVKAAADTPNATAPKEETVAPEGAPATKADGAGGSAVAQEKQQPPPTPMEQPAPKPAAEAPAPIKTITAVKAVEGGIEIAVAGGVEKFTSFNMTGPPRVVIDLLGVKKYTASRVTPVGKFGISNARIGLTSDKARVVLDVAGDRIPSYQIAKEENGLKVTFTGAPPATAPPVKAEAEKTGATAKPPAVVPAIESIDFAVSDGYSRITVKVDSGCRVGKPVPHIQGYLLSVDSCQIPTKLQRMIDTVGFSVPVKAITPYQVKNKGKLVAKLLVKVRAGTPFNFSQEGAVVHWDFKNPNDQPSADSASLAGRPAGQEGTAETSGSEPKAGLLRELSGDQTQLSGAAPADKKKYTGRRVTLEFSDADIRKIFQLIAEVSNLNFLIADDVTGTISIKLVNVPWDQALDVILESKNLEMKRDGNIIQIKPAGKFKTLEQGELEAKKARERAMELHTVVFDINYAAVSDVVTQLTTLKTARDGVSIAQDARTNRVIVTEIAPAIEKMRALLKTLDTPEKQVMIEARIVEASSTFTRDLGVQWGLHFVDGSAGNLFGISKLDTGFGGIVTAPPTSGTSGPGAAVGMSFGKLASNIQLDLRLSAAATNGQIKIISTPKVVTLNNKAAKISQGQSIPYQTTSAEGTKTEFVEAALTLEVTPHITSDGNIGMKIKASNNSPGTGSPPPINKKEATTELQVKNGETTVIGGIYVDSDTESDTGVPFLQDVPLLGWLFKSNAKTKTKTELLIFITPRIVN